MRLEDDVNLAKSALAGSSEGGLDFGGMRKGIPVNCGPMGLPTGRHLLYRNNGDGTFTDVSTEAGIDKATERYGMTDTMPRSPL